MNPVPKLTRLLFLSEKLAKSEDDEEDEPPKSADVVGTIPSEIKLGRRPNDMGGGPPSSPPYRIPSRKVMPPSMFSGLNVSDTGDRSSNPFCENQTDDCLRALAMGGNETLPDDGFDPRLEYPSLGSSSGPTKPSPPGARRSNEPGGDSGRNVLVLLLVESI